MEMRLYVRALARWWFLPLAMLAIALTGVWIYHRLRDTNHAASTVAIMQSYYPPSGEFVAPQIGFDALAGSQDLQARIAKALNDGTTADQIAGKLSISYEPKLNQPNPSPLYKVAISDKDQQRAIKIDNIAVLEAKQLYGEINTPDPQDVVAAFKDQIAAAQQKVDDARTALIQFEQSNDAFALTQRRDQELSLILQLRGAAITTSGRGATAPSGEGAALTAARGQLSTLTALAPHYEQLTSDLSLAGAARDRLAQRVSDLQIANAAAFGKAASVTSSSLAAAQSQLSDAQDKFNTALSAFADFQTANGVSDVTAAIQSQSATVNQLVVADVTARAGSGAIGAALSREQAELNRLLSLEPQYDQLNLDLTSAEGQRSSLEQHVLDVAVGQSLPASVQVRVMQYAQIQSDLLMTLLTYGLGVFVAVFVSLTAIYALGYFEKLPASLEDVERAFGKPVIGRIPTAST